jgi:hypothetical protein
MFALLVTHEILVYLLNIKILTDVTMELLLKTKVIYPENNLDQCWVVIRNEEQLMIFRPVFRI